MKKLFLFSITCFFSTISFSQSAVDQAARTEAMNDPKFIEFKKRHDDVTAKQQGQTTQPSVYFGYDETLKSMLVGNTIPAEIPKSETFISKSEYVKVLNEWISKNKNLLKPESKNSLITE